MATQIYLPTTRSLIEIGQVVLSLLRTAMTELRYFLLRKAP
jgi:hypothetical protein